MRPRVLVLGGEEGPGERLVAALGVERATAVRELLLQRAQDWALHAFGGEAVRLVAGDSFARGLADLADLADPVGPAADDAWDTGPVVAIRPELPVWHPELATALLDDLEDGCALSLAPIFDGGLYLLALADDGSIDRASLSALDLAGPAGMSQLIALAQQQGWEVGLLRAERGLRRARDVRAQLADPLADRELRALLG